LAQKIHHVGGIAARFTRSEVKGQGHMHTNGFEAHLLKFYSCQNAFLRSCKNAKKLETSSQLSIVVVSYALNSFLIEFVYIRL